jgi:competence protein ComFB
MEFRNYMEELAVGVLEEILSRQKIGCKCQRCRLDIAALALNNLPPKYAVTDIGRAHTKLEATKTQFQIDVVKELTKAIEKVNSNPRH